MSKQPEKLAVDESHAQLPDPIEDALDSYPLRDPSEDPRWAVRTIWTWVGMALFLLLFIITLLILGVWFD